MILEKKMNHSQYSEFRNLFRDVTHVTIIQNDKITFDAEDSELLSYVNANFDDYIETELRLDALEAQIIGEQSTFSKIREALKI